MFQDLRFYFRRDCLYRSAKDYSSKLTKRNKLMLYCQRFNAIVMDRIMKDEIISLSFMLVHSRRYSMSRYWKIFISYKDNVVDVSREIAIILDLQTFNDNIIKTCSYGFCIEDDICRRLEKVFEMVYNQNVSFDYHYFDCTLE